MKAPIHKVKARFASRIDWANSEGQTVKVIWTVYDSARDAHAFMGTPVNQSGAIYRLVRLWDGLYAHELTLDQFQTYLEAEGV